MIEKDSFNILIGSRIRMLRESNGLTREKLAELSMMNEKYLYEVEIGKKGISAKKLFNIANALSVTMDFIVTSGESDDKRERLMYMLSSFKEEELQCAERIIAAIKVLGEKTRLSASSADL